MAKPHLITATNALSATVTSKYHQTIDFLPAVQITALSVETTEYRFVPFTTYKTLWKEAK